MSARKPSRVATRKPTRPARATRLGARPGLGSTLGVIASERSVGSPGRMTAIGAQPASSDAQPTVTPEPVTGEDAPREQPSATGGRRIKSRGIRRR